MRKVNKRGNGVGCGPLQNPDSVSEDYFSLGHSIFVAPLEDTDSVSGPFFSLGSEKRKVNDGGGGVWDTVDY